jgi:hypothetical protein
MPLIKGSSHSSKYTRGRVVRASAASICKALFVASSEPLCAIRRADYRTEGADHRQNAGDVALVEDVDCDACAHQLGCDVGLQIGEGEHEIGFEREDLRDVRGDEGRYPLLLAPDLRRPHRIAGDADDAVLLAEQVQRLHGFLGEADDAAGREVLHGSAYAGRVTTCHRHVYLGGHCAVYPDVPSCSLRHRLKEAGSAHDTA